MIQSIVKNGKIKVQRYSSSELATVYNVCRHTFKKWIEPFSAEIGPRVGRYYNIAQVEIIFNKLGLPSEITLEY